MNFCFDFTAEQMKTTAVIFNSAFYYQQRTVLKNMQNAACPSSEKWNCSFGQNDPNNKSAAGALKIWSVARMVGFGLTKLSDDQTDDYAELFATYCNNGKP